MSDTAAALTVLAFLLVALPAAYRLVLRWRRAESTRDRLIREAHQRADHAAAVEDLERVWELPAYDRELDAGCDRLRQAIRDHREDEQ